MVLEFAFNVLLLGVCLTNGLLLGNALSTPWRIVAWILLGIPLLAVLCVAIGGLRHLLFRQRTSRVVARRDGVAVWNKRHCVEIRWDQLDSVEQEVNCVVLYYTLGPPGSEPDQFCQANEVVTDDCYGTFMALLMKRRREASNTREAT